MPRWIVTLVLLSGLAVAGCGGGQDWQTKDISQLMPELQFTLTDEHGEEVTADAYEGRAVLMFFGFTHCPDVCPATMARIAGWLGQLPEADRERIRVLFVSVDPDRDDPERLRSYTAHFHEAITGLTGTQEQLRRLSKRYRVTYGYGDKDGSGDYDVSHSAGIYGFAADGEARVLIRQSDDREAVLDDLRRLAGTAG
ncbi:SCO family protein [Aquisalimonas lutea]|uniref:SCO family protein n=1 Tax=Aquisalimonas lutea TaxID=1327750 RepID=UPI0025B45F9A|nr:SCO family protein [Aquisalimonas lutea]MDN3519475.1 SCO family protein [Aquisalimonas lutea]